jgi:hypothetical protein
VVTDHPDRPSAASDGDEFDLDERTSLHPLPFEDAVRALVGASDERGDDDGDDA